MTNQEMGAKQGLALSLLLRGKSQAETAIGVGVTRQTIGNYMKNPKFAKKLNQLQMKRIEAIVKEMEILGKSANKVIKSILEDPKAKNSDRLRATELIQKESARFIEIQNLAVRTEAIEEWIENWKSLDVLDQEHWKDKGLPGG